jgi:nicotinate-nucleotide adenylyltransferase
MKIGIFGGTFNPIHVAHLYTAEIAREAVGLDEVVFVPSAVPPHKEVEHKTSAEHRMRMVELAIAGNPAFRVSDSDIRSAPMPSYSIRTVEAFKEEYGQKAEILFVMGMDSFLDIGSWHAVDKLVASCDFVTTFRPGAPHIDLGKHKFVREIDMAMLGMLDAREKHTGKVELVSGRHLWLVAGFEMDISSTEIRRRIRERKTVKYILPEPVQSYIINNKLYR